MRPSPPREPTTEPHARIAAVTQVRNDTPGRAYYLRKQAEGKTRKEAIRALKRRISDAVYHQLLADTTTEDGPGKATGDDCSIQRGRPKP